MSESDTSHGRQTPPQREAVAVPEGATGSMDMDLGDCHCGLNLGLETPLFFEMPFFS